MSEAPERIYLATASGDLIPLADHRLAVALAYQRAADVIWTTKDEDDWNYWGFGADEAAGRSALIAAKSIILALADSDALAEVQALREQVHDLAEAARLAHPTMQRMRLAENKANARAEAAVAEVQELIKEREDCNIYLKDGETPRQRMDRDHADVLSLMEMLAKDRSRREAAEAEVQALKAELDAAREENRWAYVQAAMDDRKTDAEAEAVYLRAEVRELKDTVMDLKSELDWIKDRYDV